MAGKKKKKKRRKRGGARTSPATRQPEATGSPPPSFDRRSMDKTMADIGRLLSEQEFESIDGANAFLQQMMSSGSVPSFEPTTPFEEAQELMYEAFEASGRRRVQLARQALEVSPDCADAYVLLAEETARTPQDALAFYQKGVEAAEKPPSGESAMGRRPTFDRFLRQIRGHEPKNAPLFAQSLPLFGSGEAFSART